MGDDLHIGQPFAQFLDSAVQVPQVRRGFHDPLAVQFEDDAEHSMRARMLRPHVQQELFAAPGVRRRFGPECFLLSLGDFAFRLFDRWFVQSWG